MVMEEATAAQEILHKVWGGESRAVTVEQVLELESSGKVVAEKLGFKPGEVGVVVNGRVSRPACYFWCDGADGVLWCRLSVLSKKRSLLRISIP